MTELGSVFEADDGRPRGPDLRVTVEVPRAALGAGFVAPVPMRIAADGELVERVVVEQERPDTITLHLPETLPAGAVLRLRGQGGRRAEHEQPGDLYVVVELVDRPPRADERILRAAPAPGDPAAAMHREGNDVTWWLLGGLALLCGGVLAALLWL